ncbi:MCP four helix bundle domain-containing protein [Treponema brennaborense]|uniref:MCP four helix bundle domain-containing protein n=1 Tax=Treponema brennaborense TaxID=81028 RepID=UPI0002E06448|nr:methyl-accepting chemotaxis protein [Treponema brennaborense]
MKKSLQTTLLGGFGILIVIIVAAAGFSFYNMSKMNAATAVITKKNLPAVLFAGLINNDISQYRANEFWHIVSESAEEMATVDALLEQAKTQITEEFGSYEQASVDSGDDELMRELLQLWNRYLVISKQQLDFSRVGNRSAAMTLSLGESLSLYNTISDKCLELVKYNEAESVAVEQAAGAVYRQSTGLLLAVVIFAIAAGLIIALSISNSIVSCVSTVQAGIESLAEGDLLLEHLTLERRQKVLSRRDELGRMGSALDTMVGNLTSIITNINSISSQVSEGAR